jgi:hypothetical protein
MNTRSDNSTQWLSIYLIAARSFDVKRHFRPEQVQRFREWRAKVVRQIEEGAPEYLQPARFEANLSLLFPAMARGLANGKGRVVEFPGAVTGGTGRTPVLGEYLAPAIMKGSQL